MTNDEREVLVAVLLADEERAVLREVAARAAEREEVLSRVVAEELTSGGFASRDVYRASMAAGVRVTEALNALRRFDRLRLALILLAPGGEA